MKRFLISAVCLTILFASVPALCQTSATQDKYVVVGLEGGERDSHRTFLIFDTAGLKTWTCNVYRNDKPKWYFQELGKLDTSK